MFLLGIFGSSGFAKEVAPLAKQMLSTRNEVFEVCFVSHQFDRPTHINGYRVLSEDDFIAAAASEKRFSIAIADSKVREKISLKMELSGILPIQLSAPNVVILDNNLIGDGAILCPGTIITSDIKIGKHFHANLNSYVAHDCIIEDYVTFAPNVHCNGNILIKKHAYIGTGAILKQGANEKPLVIGEGAVVGMGAVVTKDVPDFAVVIGNPAKPMSK